MQKIFNNLGNSKAVIIPATIRKHLGFDDYYELIERPDGVLIKPVRSVRSGWKEAAKTLQAQGLTEEEKLWLDLDPQLSGDEDWQW